MVHLQRLFLASFVILFASSAALAWGCKGHQTVALIAEKHLSPEARKFLEELLKQNPIDPQLKRYCGNSGGGLFADASTWPDDVRTALNNGPWHYIDIPRSVTQGSVSEFCGKSGCVTQAIADQLKILEDSTADPRKRADAVRYIVHFVGDLHMPLHATDNNDLGGNCVPLRYFRRRPHERHHSYTPNLHGLWDTAIPERDMEGADPGEYAESLDVAFASATDGWEKAGIHLDNWAWESHALAESFAYGQLTPTVPTEKPVEVHSCSDDNNIGQRLLDLHFYAGESYQQAAGPIVEERLAQAGIRLAMVLNDAFVNQKK